MCVLPKFAECERLHGANVENNDAFFAPIVVRPILPRLVELEANLQRHRQELQMLEQVLANIQDFVHSTIVFRVNVRRTVAVDSMAERKTEEKRERHPQGMAAGKKEMNQLKAADQRRMKLQYKNDRKSNASRRLPTRFTRR